jgi:hypothetical protein
LYCAESENPDLVSDQNSVEFGSRRMIAAAFFDTTLLLDRVHLGCTYERGTAQQMPVPIPVS